MGKIKINKGGNYTVISNHVLQNNNLSLKAKGLYAFMWSLPDTWDYSVSGLTTVLKEGRDAINEALKELEREGYLVRSILRKGGKFTDMDYTLNEFPDPFMEKHESKNEKPKEKPEPKKKKKKKSYAQIFEDPKNEIIKQSLVKYIGALRGMNYTPQVATVEKFAEFLNAECKGNPVIAIRIVDQSIDRGWKALYPLKDKQISGVVSTPYNPAELARDDEGNLKVF